jgi:hypothetical protein
MKMDARDLFLEQHSLVHSAAVGGNKASGAERTFGGVTDEQMRVRPREDLNSLAWIMWHIARSEDIMLGDVIAGRAQVLGDGWAAKLNVSRRDLGTGMTSADVSELTRQLDLAALRDYRDAVGRRTREIVGGFGAKDWEGPLTAERLSKVAAQGDFGPRAEMLVKVFTGRPRSGVMSGLALVHPAHHLGEAATIRSAGGFGTGF